MIQPLRRWHRRTFFGLALMLPILFTAALAARKPAASERAPLESRGSSPPLAWRAPVTFQLGGQAATLRESTCGAWIEIDPTADPLAPDLLVYWSDTPPGPNGPPEYGHLLGAVAGSGAGRLPVSAPLRHKRGYLTFYSLARQEVAGIVRLGGQP